MLQSINHHCCSPLDLLWEIHISLVLRSPEQDTQIVSTNLCSNSPHQSQKNIITIPTKVDNYHPLHPLSITLQQQRLAVIIWLWIFQQAVKSFAQFHSSVSWYNNKEAGFLTFTDSDNFTKYVAILTEILIKLSIINTMMCLTLIHK